MLYSGSGEDGRVVKSTGCSYVGTKFDSQHPHSDSQSPVTLVLRDLIPSSDLHRHQVIYIYRNMPGRIIMNTEFVCIKHCLIHIKSVCRSLKGYW